MDSASVAATPAALEAVERLQDLYGPLAFFQSAGCCDGSLPICVQRDELPPAQGDKLLGRIGDAPFYIDAELHRRWGSPRLIVELAAGEAEGFSLSPPDTHFATKPTPSGGEKSAGVP